MKEIVQNRLIISGNVIEEVSYSIGYLKGGVTPNPLGRSGGSEGLSDEDKRVNRGKVMTRAKQRLRRLINANVGQYDDITPKFMTLTFADNVQNLKLANNEWKKFIKRLNFYMFRKKINLLKYSVVIEFQKRGAIHYHAIFYNLPYVESKKIADIWGQGFIKINKIDNVDNIGAYVVKYMGKDLDDDRLYGKKSYFNSRDLLEPLEITDKKKIDALVGPLSHKLVYSIGFDNDYMGHIHYNQYNTDRGQEKD